jgi:hypothetical protein
MKPNMYPRNIGLRFAQRQPTRPSDLTSGATPHVSPRQHLKRRLPHSIPAQRAILIHAGEQALFEGLKFCDARVDDLDLVAQEALQGFVGV